MPKLIRSARLFLAKEENLIPHSFLTRAALAGVCQHSNFLLDGAASSAGAPPMGITSSSLTITITERVDRAVGDLLADRLRPFVEVEEVQVYERKAADPAIQQLIQILGSVPVWQYLAAGGAAYLARLGYLLADDSHAAFRAWTRSDAGKPIATTAAALSDAARETPGARVCIGLDIPDDMFGSVLEVSGREPDAIALELLPFVMHAEQVAAVIVEAETKGDGVLSQPRITLLSDGEVKVRWMTLSGKWREVTIKKRLEAA